MNELIIVPPCDCPNCESKTGGPNCDYKCPLCGAVFCSRCYKTDPNGPGNYVFCPVCKKQLFFPSRLLASFLEKG